MPAPVWASWASSDSRGASRTARSLSRSSFRTHKKQKARETRAFCVGVKSLGLPATAATAAAATAATAAATAAAAAAATATILRLVDIDVSAIKLDTVHLLDGGACRTVVRKRHEPESTATTGLTVADHRGLRNLTKLFKRTAQAVVIRVPAETTNE